MNSSPSTRGGIPTFNPERVFTQKELIAIFGIQPQKFNGWLEGIKSKGKAREGRCVPLRHFRDGDTVLVRGSWFLDFLECNPNVDPESESDR